MYNMVQAVNAVMYISASLILSSEFNRSVKLSEYYHCHNVFVRVIIILHAIEVCGGGTGDAINAKDHNNIKLSCY